MDQRVVAGLGNIYVNEILFRAGVRPRRSMARTTIDECARIVDATREVIANAIEHRGSTISDFLDGIGRRGGYQLRHQVYDREGKPCPACGAPIKSVVVGQRSSFYCPSCQR
jgi:formamidopyrimidine-DNA glycosylase